jgi:tetratricopeptide (TPR) repeat protein
MTSPLTVGERIILHLARYSKHREDYDVPLDVSQDGIASAIRISRAHAAIELKKLKETEDVSERLAHIRKGRNRRKVYFLTTRGEDKANSIRDFAEKEGIDIRPLLDLRRCSGKELWESLDKDERWVLARACTFRGAFRREALSETGLSLLPEDREGIVEMPPELREQVLSMVDEPQRRECHSFAADHCLDEGHHKERLYHLLSSGRSMEAHMLISSRGGEMLRGADDDLFATCEMLDEPPDRYRSRVYRFLAELCLRTGHGEECLGILSSLRGRGDVEDCRFASIVEGRLLMQTGDPETALGILTEARGNDLDVGLECEICRAMIDCGRKEEAISLLEELLPETAKFGDGARIADIQFLLGTAHLKKGEASDAIKYLSKGMGVSRETDLTRWYSKMSEAYLALGMREKADEFQSKIPRSRKWSSA